MYATVPLTTGCHWCSAYDFKNDGWNPKDQRDADQAWYRKLAYRMRFIEETYNKLRGDPKGMSVMSAASWVSECIAHVLHCHAAKDVLYAGMGDKRARSETAGREVDHYTNGWISVADTVLRKARDQYACVTIRGGGGVGADRGALGPIHPTTHAAGRIVRTSL
jgi:hypothetical protein